MLQEQMIQEKNNDIIKEIDKAINELVYEKSKFIKAYNYYNGKRDPEQFRHLEENYGIGTSSAVEFVPLVRKHIDVLIGEYLSTPVLPRISCKDKTTISNIYRDKQLAINNEVIKVLNKHLLNTIYSNIQGKQGVEDSQIKAEIKSAQESTERNFISDYEIAGQNIVDYLMQSRNIDFANKRKILLTDLLITGTCYYKVEKSGSGTNISIRPLNPINSFIERNPDSPYLKDSSRAVIKDFMTKHQILSKYGHLLDKDDIERLDNLEDYSQDGSSTTYIRSFDNKITGEPLGDGILGGFEVTPLLPYERGGNRFYRLYPVYEVEWLKTDKEGDKYIMNRYEGVRIGTNIYIPVGKSENVIRSVDDPSICSLSINGMFYSDRNSDPFSLVLSTANLQDKYDVLNFYKDNLIAESGSKGDWIDLAFVPKLLGQNLTERLMKWKAYKKTGVALIDSSQDGEPMNTMFGGFDDTISRDVVQAIEMAIETVENTCSSITGVFRERLNGIEQHDAVTNIQVGVKNSALITKQYYQIMDLMTREILLDSLNLAKKVYKKGVTGTIVLGTRLNKIFTALPEHYTLTDYDIHIADSADVIKDQQFIQQLVMEFSKNGNIDPEIILTAITANGLTEMKENVLEAILKKKTETNQLGQLSQQLESLQQQLKQTTSENQKLQNSIDQLDQQKLQLEREKFETQNEINWYKAKDISNFNDKKIELDKTRVQLEGAQLLDTNRKNDEIKNE